RSRTGDGHGQAPALQRRRRPPASPCLCIPGCHRRMEPGRYQPPSSRGGPALRGLWRAGRGARRRAHRAAPEDPAVTRPFDLMRRLRAGVASVLLLSATGSYALNTATIVASVASPDCLEDRVVGFCSWLDAAGTGCARRTSSCVRHYIPDAVVSSYSNTGETAWVEVRAMSTPNPSAQAGGDGTTNEDHETNLAKFKTADVIG